MRKLYAALRKAVMEQGTAVIATIIRQAGSSPRSLGTSCVIKADGSITGTIGGGLLEAMTAKAGLDVMRSGSAKRIYFSLKGTEIAKSDMLCGGEVEIFLEPVSRENAAAISIIEKILETFASKGSGVLATVVQEEKWRRGAAPKLFLGADGKLTGSIEGLPSIGEIIGKSTAEVLVKRKPFLIRENDSNGRLIELFLEPVVGELRLFIFGAGHVSAQIAPIASRVGFQVVVIDDRAEFADPARFPDASEVHAWPFEGLFDRIDVDEESFLAIVTRGHAHDRDVLAQALRTRAKYVGMIGSRRKKAAVYASLLEDGFTQNDLDRVHCPIGLEIGAETPEEIAVSIAAELIKVRAEKER